MKKINGEKKEEEKNLSKHSLSLGKVVFFLAYTYTYVAALRCGALALQDVKEEEEDGGKHGLEENIKLTEGSEF